MKATNIVRINFESRSIIESFARMVVSSYAAMLDPTVDELCDLKTAVSEAVTNCVVHAYPNKIGKVYLTCATIGEGTIRITIKDNGCGISDVPLARTACFTTGGEERSGMGFTVMECLCDKVKVRSTPGKGTSVVLEKYISKENA